MATFRIFAYTIIAAVMAVSTATAQETPAPESQGTIPPMPIATLALSAADRGESKGLQLSVQEDIVEAGSTVDLSWEIVPDSLSSVSIILGIIFPDGDTYYYNSPRDGFSLLDGNIKSAKPIMRDFPFNTSMRGVLKVELPEEWPEGIYQFISFVMEDGTTIEIVYSNSFQIEQPLLEEAA